MWYNVTRMRKETEQTETKEKEMNKKQRANFEAAKIRIIGMKVFTGQLTIAEKAQIEAAKIKALGIGFFG